MSILTVNLNFDPSSVMNKLVAWKKREKGKSNKLVREIKDNVELLQLVIRNDVPLENVINDLSSDVFRELVEEGFNFNQLKKSKIKLPARLKNTNLARWNKQSTEALIHSIYNKIIFLQTAYPKAPARIRWSVRVINIYKRIDLLLYHVSQ